MSSFNRNNGRGGGLQVVYRKMLVCRKIYKVKKEPNIKKCISFEHAICKITGKTKKNAASNSTFLNDFLVEFIPKYQNFIITGDMN